MTVIALVGMQGSGKSVAADVAEDLDIPVVTMGDVIRRRCRERDMALTEDAMGEVASELRDRGGPAAVAAHSLPMIEDALEGADGDTVLVDGIRGQAEVERFREAFGDDFLLVSIEAPLETRIDRVKDRDRDPTGQITEQEIRRRDERERHYGMDEAIDDAAIAIENDESLEAFQDRIRTLLAEGPDGLTDDPALEVHRSTESVEE
jgi:dephospho-CoA kinase